MNPIRIAFVVFSVSPAILIQAFDEKDVLVATSSNFSETVLEVEYALVEFYAPWCGHCKKLAPDYAQAASELKQIVPKVNIVKVDADAHPDLGERFGVQSYPTIKWFRNGTSEEFDGDRTARAIVNFVEKATKESVISVQTLDEFSKLMDSNRAFILAFFETLEGAQWDLFLETAAMFPSVTFAQTSSKEVAAANDVQKLTFFRHFDAGNLKYDGEWNAQHLRNFVHENKLPLVVPFTNENSAMIFASLGFDHQVLLFAKGVMLGEATRLGSQVAQDFKGKVQFFHSMRIILKSAFC
ncbi:hypothetical protein CYMTET_21667 [Cymbomonas tetramitiformis]|uniref:Thioredoxin domain-containing protein n=1 Tax=Cymbomonas tetramitiformis TaxID=36881 RepID=A0AAE0G2D5_9CHLO|nr:hypothetical protein CYMTET_21667 [Cymbomonas tetramitiformis]